VSAVKDAIGAVREALRLSDDVKRLADALKDVSIEVRDHERRMIRLEAKWEIALELSQLAGARREPPKLSNED
jgi:hypothetical protein